MFPDQTPAPGAEHRSVALPWSFRSSATADIAEASREKDRYGPIDDERDAAIDRATARLRRVEEYLSGLAQLRASGSPRPESESQNLGSIHPRDGPPPEALVRRVSVMDLAGPLAVLWNSAPVVRWVRPAS